MYIDIARGDRDAPSQLVRDFKAGLFGVRSAQQPTLIVPEAGIDNAADHRRSRNPACGSENTGGELRHARRRDRRASGTACGGRGCDWAADGRLNEQPSYGRHPGKDYVGVRQIARAAQLNDADQLPDAGELAVIENPEPGAHDGARAEGVSQAHARLKIVQVPARHKKLGVSLKVVTQAQRERQIGSRLPLILAKKPYELWFTLVVVRDAISLGTACVNGTGSAERVVVPLANPHQKTTGVWFKKVGPATPGPPRLAKITRAGKKRSNRVVSRILLKSAPNFSACPPETTLRLSDNCSLDSP